MNFLHQRQVLAAPYEWKREREMELKLRIEIEAALLQSWRTELAELRRLEGMELVHRSACETSEELERTLHGKRIWWEELKALWIRLKHPANTARAA